MTQDKNFTFYWRFGKRDVYVGLDVADALNKQGYGGGVLAALDFWAKGDDKSYSWCENKKDWAKVLLPI